MSDYDVDMAELAFYASMLDGVGDTISSHLAAQQLTAMGRGMGGGDAARASAEGVAQTWADAVGDATAHLASHSATLGAIARAYQGQEDDARTQIRGFYEGRLA